MWEESANLFSPMNEIRNLSRRTISLKGKIILVVGYQSESKNRTPSTPNLFTAEISIMDPGLEMQVKSNASLIEY